MLAVEFWEILQERTAETAPWCAFLIIPIISACFDENHSYLNFDFVAVLPFRSAGMGWPTDECNHPRPL